MKIKEMKKATAIATIQIAKGTIERFATILNTTPGIESVRPTFETKRLNDLHEFLQRLTEKEFEEISSRQVEVKLKNQPSLF